MRTAQFGGIGEVVKRLPDIAHGAMFASWAINGPC